MKVSTEKRHLQNLSTLLLSGVEQDKIKKPLASIKRAISRAKAQTDVEKALSKLISLFGNQPEQLTTTLLNLDLGKVEECSSYLSRFIVFVSPVGWPLRLYYPLIASDDGHGSSFRQMARTKGDRTPSPYFFLRYAHPPIESVYRNALFFAPNAFSWFGQISDKQHPFFHDYYLNFGNKSFALTDREATKPVVRAIQRFRARWKDGFTCFFECPPKNLAMHITGGTSTEYRIAAGQNRLPNNEDLQIGRPIALSNFRYMDWLHTLQTDFLRRLWEESLIINGEGQVYTESLDGLLSGLAIHTVVSLLEKSMVKPQSLEELLHPISLFLAVPKLERVALPCLICGTWIISGMKAICCDKGTCRRRYNHYADPLAQQLYNENQRRKRRGRKPFTRARYLEYRQKHGHKKPTPSSLYRFEFSHGQRKKPVRINLDQEQR